MSTHSPEYLRRRTIVRTLFWTPITALGFWMIGYGLVAEALATR